jgi:class 3 adenylate cyclase
MPLGHRKRLMKAIAALGDPSAASAEKISAPIEPAPRESAERRHLTVMFCDLVGSTALSTKLDPEDLRVVIGAYHKCVAATVAQFDGFVAKYIDRAPVVMHKRGSRRYGAKRARVCLMEIAASNYASDFFRDSAIRSHARLALVTS